MTIPTNSRFRVYRPQPAPQLRLLVFPHGGGSASFYRGWAELLPDGIELGIATYPGREDRLLDAHPETLESLAAQYVMALPLGAPVVLFGHSMGAAVAFEVARRTVRKLDRLIVSGRPAPHRQRPGDVHLRDEAGLLAELRRLGGSRTELFDDPEIRELVLPMIRADYRLIERYRGIVLNTVAPLDIPVTAVHNTADPELTGDEAAAWASYTRAGFDLHTLPGGHFYLSEHETDFVAWLAGLLAPARVLWPSTP